MKVVLLNKHPVVSRLVKLSLEKIGYELEEISNLTQLGEQSSDILICDSDMADENLDYTPFAKEIIFLIPRNYEKKLGKHCLEKPFLPTDFIEFVQKISSKISPVTTNPNKIQDNELDDFNNTDVLDNTDFSDIEDDDFDSSIDSLDIVDSFDKNSDDILLADENFSMDNDDLNEIEPKMHDIEQNQQTNNANEQEFSMDTTEDELSDNKNLDFSSDDIQDKNEKEFDEKESELKTLSSIVQQIDDLDEEDEIFNPKSNGDELLDLDSINGFIPPQNINQRQKNADDEVLDDFVQDLESDENDKNLQETSETLENETLENETLENETLENETLENETLENETLEDETLEDETLEDETLEDETLEDENSIQENENLAKEIANDEADDILEQNLQATQAQENSQVDNLEKNADDEDFKSISELDIARALGDVRTQEFLEAQLQKQENQNLNEQQEKTAQNDKNSLEQIPNLDELSKQLGQNLSHILLNTNNMQNAVESIRKALKGMKIKIDISFEE